ncbi:uncharacterized protein LOC126879010 [Diabrotica virgifera virgifera]|uniref:Uncharacterized protein n=1 Tax=Diabrotica virgifera virgifera TaxID=50390 RepID=A0ABM5JIS9_DIAVI|nr:uncharacterized protein LOC126879010 [Diabrotica virgifera virgifera]
MKGTIFCVVLIACVLTTAADKYSHLGEAVKECGAEHGGPNEIKGPMDLQKHGATAFCILNKGEIITENGDIIENTVREIYRNIYATETEVDAVIHKCGTKNGKTREEVAFNLFACFEHLPPETKKKT